LSGHPQVRPATDKELHYFDRFHPRGERWYRSQFPLAKKGTITGEATAYTFLHPLAPARIAHDLPNDTTLILMLREPADRAISRYRRARAQGHETETLERALALEPERMARAEDVVARGDRSHEHEIMSYVSGGHYATLLQRWQEHVGTERIITFESEQFVQDPAQRQELLRALGLEPYEGNYPILNTFASPVEGEPAIRGRLEEYFRPHNEDLFALLGRRLWGQ
jgi:hypothetical protein